MDELKKKLEELGRAFEEFKSANDARLKEIQTKGAASALSDEKVDKANSAISGLQEQIQRLQKSNDDLATAFNRVAAGEREDKGDGKQHDSKELKSAFTKFLRKGKDGMTADEIKAMSVDSDPDGGYLVRPELAAGIVTKIFETSPIRQLADVTTIGSDALEIMEDPNEVSTGWVSERGTRSATATSQLNKGRIVAEEQYAEPTVTQKLLDDAFFDVDSWLQGKVADKLARTENTAFVVGSGVGQPKGFCSYASGTSWGQIEQVGSGSSGNVTADTLIDFCYKLHANFVANASWLMARATEAAIRKIKDSQNRYLWEPSLQLGRPATFLGHPIYWAADMAAMASNSLSIAFGDFKQGYKIVDRIGIRILRDPFTTKGSVLFYSTKRTGGAVQNFDAIKLYKCG